MKDQKYKIVGLGEILWDVFPAGRQLGGAPANFAYITRLLGDDGIAASRLGDDAIGQEARQQLDQLGVPTQYLQTDSAHATGTVNVHMDNRGQHTFEIIEQVAWDFLEWTPQWQQLAQQVDAVCYGSLAQRAPVSRATIQNFLHATRSDALRVFDVNLRQTFFTREVLLESMRQASIVKVNHEELPVMMDILQIESLDDCSSARRLAAAQNLQLVCVTRGPRGSLIINRNGEVSEHPGYRIRIADTVGAGDAFTAAMVHQYLRGASIERINEAANRMGAWVASQVGGMPEPLNGKLDDVLAAIQ